MLIKVHYVSINNWTVESIGKFSKAINNLRFVQKLFTLELKSSGRWMWIKNKKKYSEKDKSYGSI